MTAPWPERHYTPIYSYNIHAGGRETHLFQWSKSVFTASLNGNQRTRDTRIIPETKSNISTFFFLFPLQRIDGLTLEDFVIHSGVSKDSVPSIINFLFIHDLLKSTAASVYPVLTTVPFSLLHFSRYLSCTSP